jgi:hypothetical protein
MGRWWRRGSRGGGFHQSVVAPEALPRARLVVFIRETPSRCPAIIFDAPSFKALPIFIRFRLDQRFVGLAVREEFFTGFQGKIPVLRGLARSHAVGQCVEPYS